MAALAASVARWIPEDDLLLKTAVEGGASLEALAKGAVRFSRRFTLGELRDRWYSLLYDPIISAEASGKMVEFEHSVTNAKTTEVSAKRKLDSVRRLYYVMRKKTCHQGGNFLGHPDSGFRDDNMVFGDCNRTHFGFVGKDCYNEIHDEVPTFEHDGVGDGLVDFQSCDRVKEIGMPESSSSFNTEGLSSPLAMWEMIEGISRIDGEGQEEVMVHRDGVELGGSEPNFSRMNANHPEAILQEKHDLDVLNNSTSFSECDYADLSNSLLNFPNEDELLLVDADGEEVKEKNCNDDILVTGTDDLHGSSPDVKNLQTLVQDRSLGIPKDECPAEAIAEGSLSEDAGQHSHIHSKSNLLSSLSAANAENYDGELKCILNSEDTEIPCNDDIVFCKEFASSRIAIACKGSDYVCFPCANLKDDKLGKSSVNKEENSAKSLIGSQVKGLETKPLTNAGNQFVDSGVKCRSPTMVNKYSSDAHRDVNQYRTAHVALASAKVGMQLAEPLHPCDAVSLPLYSQSCSPKQISSATETDPSLLNDKEPESDDDVPTYSEIEAMILKMDLCPDDANPYSYREVSQYQNEYTRRTIIRLEQCAQSSMQRDIASRGAFAILYGRHLKHYIRKTEVILGRATDDMEVDINLGREGPANRISRRQALIKLETNGSFLLKNLGKSPVFLNGKEVVTGQNMCLNSSSLIEIGEMAFMFEINSKSVAHHLSSAAKKCKGNNVKFEWSEGFHEI